MKNIFPKLLLGATIILAFFLRVWRVGEIPPSLSWDEASIGYNAYSILKTGRDEHGRFFPLDTFAAFGDYKPSLSIYLSVPAVAVFGLNEFAVRFPSVIAGTIAVFLTYFLVQELFSISRFTSHVSHLTSFLLAISPWHIQLSRGGFEANIALALILAGTVFFLQARRRSFLFLIAPLPFVAAIYTFNSARFSGPLLAIGLVVFCYQAVQKHLRWFLFGVIIASLALLPILPHLISAQSRLRFTEVNIFSNAQVVVTANKRIDLDDNSWWSKIIHNRRIGYAREYLVHFFDNLEPWFLFIRGDGNPKFSIQDVGQLYLIELPLFVVGILWLFRLYRRQAWFMFWWIIAAIIPAATARETPHALRIENSLPMWQLFVAAGIAATISKIKNQKLKMYVLAGAIGLLYVGNFAYYWHNYYNHYAKEYSGEWQWGYREAIYFASTIKYRYKEVVIDDIIGRPYIYALFYEKYDPQKFQDSPNRTADAAGFFHVESVGQYRFVDRKPMFKKNTLYILRPGFVPEKARIINSIEVLNGSPVLIAFEIIDPPQKL